MCKLRGVTALARLVESYTDPMAYTTYVFEFLDQEIRKYDMYVMCTRFPNWDHPQIKKGEIGYLNFVEIQAGIDKWFDGSTMIPYNYNMVQFIKFIPKKEDKEYVV